VTSGLSRKRAGATKGISELGRIFTPHSWGRKKLGGKRKQKGLSTKKKIKRKIGKLGLFGSPNCRVYYTGKGSRARETALGCEYERWGDLKGSLNLKRAVLKKTHET